MTAVNGPTLVGYKSFIRNGMGITIAQLPDNSFWIGATLNFAMTIVNKSLIGVASSYPLGLEYPSLYALACYNFAGDRLINVAPDQSGQTYFTDMRASCKILSFVSGVIQSTGDESTNQSMVVPEAFKDFTVADLQSLKTPWGRMYLGIAQQYGPTIWGKS